MGLNNKILSFVFLVLLCPGNVFAESITFEILRLRLLATFYYRGRVQAITLRVSPTDERWDHDFTVPSDLYSHKVDNYVSILRIRIHGL